MSSLPNVAPARKSRLPGLPPSLTDRGTWLPVTVFLAKRIITRFVPAKRLSGPDEHSKIVLFLCSDAASFMFGHLVRVDGGGFEASAIDMEMPA